MAKCVKFLQKLAKEKSFICKQSGITLESSLENIKTCFQLKVEKCCYGFSFFPNSEIYLLNSIPASPIGLRTA